MKKELVCILLLSLFFLPFVSAQEDTSSILTSDEDIQQVLTPKEVFVGDTAQITYSFRSAVDFFAFADKQRISGDTLTLTLTQKAFTSVADKCSLINVVLKREDLSYTLIVTFIPWKTGVIDLGPFDLYTATRNSDASNTVEPKKDDVTFVIDLAPIKVASLVERTGARSLKPPVPPMTVPGTNYLVWSLIIMLILLLIGAGVVLTKLQQLVQKIQIWKKQIGFYRNSNSTYKKLRKLSENTDFDDGAFASEWQLIMRTYLEKRFGTSFSAIPASKIVLQIISCTGDMLSPELQNVVTTLSGLFYRTDYIRFAVGSVDSELLPAQEHQASFLEQERAQLIERTNDIVKQLEMKDEKEGEAK